MRVWSLGREDPLEEGMANPLQYSCLENPKDRGAWWATVHGVAKSQTWLKWLSTHARVMAAWVKTMRHITKAYDSWLTHQMSWVEGKGGFKEEQRKEGGREASSSSSIQQEACFLGAYPAGGWFLSPHCNPCIWGSLKNGSTCLFQNISGVVIVQNLLWVMKKREVSLTNSDYHRHPSHSPVIPNQFISIQPWNSSCYPVSISHLSFNSKFKNPVIPFTNEFFWFGSRIKVPWIRLLIFFFFTKNVPNLNLSTFTSHSHAMPTAMVKVGTSSLHCVCGLPLPSASLWQSLFSGTILSHVAHSNGIQLFLSRSF